MPTVAPRRRRRPLTRTQLQIGAARRGRRPIGVEGGGAVIEATDIRVRTATRGDARSVAELVRALGYAMTEEQAVERLQAFDDSERDAVLVAETAASIHGLVVVSLMPSFVESGFVGRVIALAVAPNARRRGAGQALLAAAEERAVAAGSRLMQINCGRRPERAMAHRFYPRCGYSDQHEHHILYTKNL